MEAIFVIAGVLTAVLLLCIVCAVAVVRARSSAHVIVRAAMLRTVTGGGRSRRALAEELALENCYGAADEEPELEPEPRYLSPNTTARALGEA